MVGSVDATSGFDTDDVEATLDADGAVAPAQSLRPGEAVGRYRLIECVGRGAMGSVFAAYDPQLDRRVALKVLHDLPHDDVLLAEARTLARLSHPNVIAVFDVGRTFVAMEFVVGRTLRQWVNDHHDDPAAVLAAFVDAGRGLAAAHAAGIVHRDFKPENVLVGDDGRVRVGDFGLARPLSAPSLDAVTNPGAGETTLATRQAGTPAYMAPELFLGQPADARSDAFAFCVALWEALHGARPFVGRSVPELMSSISESVPEPPSGHDAAVVAVLRRGLHPDPVERFVDMPQLLAALAPVSKRRTWRPIAALALAGGVIAAVVLARPGGESCDTEWPAWSPTSRAAIASAIDAVEGEGMTTIAADAADDLDRFATSHARLRTQICALRTTDALRAAEAEACVLRMRQNADAVIDVFARADKAIVMASASLRGTLGDPTTCLEQRDAGQPIAADPLRMARAEPVRADLARARVFMQAGQVESASSLLDAAEQGAGELDDPAVRAEALLLRGQLFDELGDGEAARRAYYDALEWATRARDRRTAAAVWIEIIYCEGYLHGDEAAADVAIRQSEAEIAALGGDELLDLQRMSRMVPAYFSAGRLDEARTLALDAAKRYREQGRELDAANALMNVANIDLIGLRLDDARRALDEVEQIWTTKLPNGHPFHARIPELRAHLAEKAGDIAGATVFATEAYQLRRAALGEAHVDTLTLLGSLVDLAIESSDLDRALELSAEMIRHGQHHQNIATRLRALTNRAAVFVAAGRAAQAEPLLVETAALVEASIGVDSPRRLDFYRLRAEVAAALGRTDDAIADLDRVIELESSTWDPDHPNPTRTRLDAADLLRDAGRVDESRARLDRITASLDAQASHPAVVRLDILVDLAIQRHACSDLDQARVLVGRAEALIASDALEASEAAKLLRGHAFDTPARPGARTLR